MAPQRNHKLNEEDFLALRNRIGDVHLGGRMRLQVDHSVQVVGDGKGRFHFENIPSLMKVLKFLLKVTGTYRWGTKNACDIKVCQNQVELHDLPVEFDGFRILHLSDLHLDGHPGFGKHIGKTIQSLQYDLCVITGDFRFDDIGQYDNLSEELHQLVQTIDCKYGIFAILGNHDFIEQVPIFEQMGIDALLNEAVQIEQSGQKIWLIGVDDPHYYGLDNLSLAMTHIHQDDSIKILLAHSPEIYQEASDKEIHLYLSGHTHGGQICTPWGYALMKNANCPRKYLNGPWQFKNMLGYTSAGTGSSGVFVRFFCSPEVTIHILNKQIL